mgnify:FL=1
MRKHTLIASLTLTAIFLCQLQAATVVIPDGALLVQGNVTDGSVSSTIDDNISLNSGIRSSNDTIIRYTYNSSQTISAFYLWNDFLVDGTAGIRNFTLTFFDGSNMQIGAVYSGTATHNLLPYGMDDSQVFSTGSYAGVTRIDLDMTSSLDNLSNSFQIREVAFGQIPEPNAFLLLGLGICGFVSRRWRH